MSEEIELATIRKKIDEVDRELVTLILKRFELVSKISEVKKKRNLETIDSERESNILTTVTKLAEEGGLKGVYIKNIFRAIIENCATFERDLMRK
jgi:chorismate mutase